VFLVNSRLNLFTAAPSRSTRKGHHDTGALLIPKLRSHFAEFLNEGYLAHLSILYFPTCVGFGTGARNLPRGFSWSHGVRDSPAQMPAAIVPQVMQLRIYLEPPLRNLVQEQPSPATPSLTRPPISQTGATRYRNINLLSIDYAFRPRLRSRLTLSRRTLLRNP
jgi:hypothetical protein